MSTLEKKPVENHFLRYFSVFLSQFTTNREYFYFWTLATFLDITIFELIHPWNWALVTAINLLTGILAIGSVVRPIDKAFETIGLDYSKGYGKPTWIVEGKYPLQSESYRIRAAGYDATDFEKFIPQISSRLCKPIKSINKPSAMVPELEVIIKRSNIPSSLLFSALNLNDLSQGEFYIGQTEDQLLKLSLTKMIHMLVAGQTGAGKTQFIKQFITTVLTRTRSAFVCLIDMKGGIDFQAFSRAKNFQMVTSHSEATVVLDQCIELFNRRKSYLLQKNKTNWSELSLKEIEQEKCFQDVPVGPVVIVVDELAELSKKATEKSAKSELQEKIATLARLARFTGIHLVLGTQRPDKSTLDMQSKDNLPSRVCFSVPSVTASTLVIGDMTASTLGAHPGRAVFQLSGNQIIQAPFIKNSEIEALMDSLYQKTSQSESKRKLVSFGDDTQTEKPRLVLK